MKKVCAFLLLLMIYSTTISAQVKLNKLSSERKLWLQYLDTLARPILSNLAEDNLRKNFPVALATNPDDKELRTKVAFLEAFGRLLSGIAPWLNSEGGAPDEVALRNQYRKWTLKAIANAVNPSSKDYMEWTGPQPLVDASFLSLGLIRCPWLWNHMDEKVQQQVVTAFKTTRAIVPTYNNWVLFSAMIEAFFIKYNQPHDDVRIEYAIREYAHHWYAGDGLFTDGEQFHMDYYNSYVIQPFLTNILEVVSKQSRSYNWYAPKLDTITKRFAEIQERMINMDGTFPVTGRSIIYRGGAFHHLADMAFRKRLPPSLNPAQVRSALTAVIKKTSESPSAFTKKGLLNIGLYSHQPQLGDYYITTGSLYLCANILLPLGLPETDEFWAAPSMPWTAVKVWKGEDFPADHALNIK